MQRQTHHAADIKEPRSAQTIPFDRWILSKVAFRLELSILNEEDGADDHRRDLLESIEDRAIARDVSQNTPIARANSQTRNRRLVVGRIDAPADQPHQPHGVARLTRDREAFRFEPRNKLRDL